MNDPKVLELYMQLAFFRRDLFSEELLFRNPDQSLQYLIHSLARKLDLEYVLVIALSGRFGSVFNTCRLSVETLDT